MRKILRPFSLARVAAAVAAGSLLAASPARPSGLESIGIGARGRAMGYALTAAPGDWSALFYNPAGLAGLAGVPGSETACVYEYFSGGSTSSLGLRNLPLSGGADPARGDFVDPIGGEPPFFPEDSVAATVHAGELGWARGDGRFGWGVGLFGSGAGSEWSDQVPAGADLLAGEVSFRNISVNLPVGGALRVSPRLDLGATLTFRYGRLDAEFNKVRTGPVFPYRQTSRQETSGAALSAEVGALWDAGAGWWLGLVGRLPYAIEKEGDTRVTNTLAALEAASPTSVREQIPLRVAGGAAWTPAPGHLLAASLTWHDWSGYRRSTDYAPPVPFVLVSSPPGNPSRWRDAWTAGVGYEGPLAPGWSLRCGLAWDQAPEPREYRTLVGGQTVDGWKVGLGAGRRGAGSSLDFGWTYTLAPEVEGYIPGARYGLTYHELYLGYRKEI